MEFSKKIMAAAGGLLVLVLFLFSGCGVPKGNGASGEAYRVTDDFGTVVSFAKKPKRIYATTLGLNEILAALVPPERIVAVPESALNEKDSLIYEEARKVEKAVPDHLSTEQIIALKPDLVLLQSNGDRSEAKTLRDMGIPVCEMKVAVTYDLVVHHIQTAADATGEPEKGKEVIAAMENKLEKVNSVISEIPEEKRKILMAYSMNGVFGSKDGLFHQICTMAGVKNGAAVAGLERGEHLSKEAILAVNPDYFLFPERAFVSNPGGDIDRYVEEVVTDPALQGVKAVQKKQIIKIKDRYRYATSQFLADAVYEIASKVYSEEFKKASEKF